MTSPTPLHVAAAVIRDAAGRVLLARRPDHLHQGGRWEFPGGKLDAGEAVAAALVRELAEELGILATRYHPLLCIDHAYADRRVRLDVWEVNAYQGTPRPLEGQALTWAAIDDLDDYTFPAADVPVLTALKMPHRVAAEPGLAMDGRPLWLASRDASLTSDEPHLKGDHLKGDRPLFRKAGPGWRGRYCGSAADLARARVDGCDFAVLAATPSVSGSALAALLRGAGMPVFVTGVGGASGLARVRRLGGHGIVKGINGKRSVFPVFRRHE